MGWLEEALAGSKQDEGDRLVAGWRAAPCESPFRTSPTDVHMREYLDG